MADAKGSSEDVKVRTDLVKTQNPQSVSRDAVEVPKEKVGDMEVNTRPPDTDIADVRADDTPAQAAEKIKAAREGRVKQASNG